MSLCLPRFVVALSTAFLLAACGGDDDDSDKLSRTTLKATSGQYWGVPRFSMDGRIAFVRALEQGDTYEVAVMKEDGTDVRKLAGDGTYLTGLAWSPDGSLYYSGEKGISLIPATGGTATVVYDAFAAAELDVSPDGKLLAYRVNGGGLYLLDLEGRIVRELNDDGSAPAFSRDGKRLAFIKRSEADVYEIRTLELANPGTSQLVAKDANYLSAVDWLPDGRLAAITEEGISLFDLSGATPQGRLVRDEFAAKELDVSPDGEKMVYAINGQADLYVLTGF
ncbi:PD40 domain-containing protein [Pyxidicoccus parkwayensis]|uniref:PD40 domain-containing protein n=1 Tax=Pyxidicoccus parkwayensis TaxID=2813578 RepID=A0ABX7NU84_9BACT|nr:PD40 domain-containing protein [Pyxidicoccus parkwaysis]QSQ22472.1 PD40 domain-containing protein [Pyxidicoccus parkwaysis]